jgi:hypothetical protein
MTTSENKFLISLTTQGKPSYSFLLSTVLSAILPPITSLSIPLLAYPPVPWFPQARSVIPDSGGPPPISIKVLSQGEKIPLGENPTDFRFPGTLPWCHGWLAQPCLFFYHHESTLSLFRTQYEASRMESPSPEAKPKAFSHQQLSFFPS